MLRRWVGRAATTSKVVAGVLAVSLLVAPGVRGPAGAERLDLVASSYLCSGYTGCQAAGYGSGGYAQASGRQYWKMFTGHNCTNYVAYRLIRTGMPDVRPWSGDGNAMNWGVAMAGITDQTPTVGSVAWYKPGVSPAGSKGHVAYVEQVVSENEIIVSEDYWGGDFHWRRVTRTAGGGWPTGFIHFNDRVVAPTTAPSIVGTPAVGSPVEVAPGAWTPTPASVTVRWLADGAAIPGATTTSYVPTPDVKGKTLTAEVTAALDGYAAGQASLATAPVAPGRFQATAVPAIEGTPEVGQTLTLTSASWAPQPARQSTQWYADGVAVPGATGPTFVLTRDHVDRRISARVQASAAGFKKASSRATETAPVLAKAVAVSAPSRVSGAPVVGRKLVVRPGTLRPSDARATYTWFRDGARIAGTTKPAYTVRRADLGRALSVRITWSRTHFRATTESVAVAAVTTVPEVRVRPDASRKRVVLDVRVTATGATRPDGSLTVSVGGRSVDVPVVAGRARAVVKGARPGTRPVVVRWSGTDLVRPAVVRSSVDVPR